MREIKFRAWIETQKRMYEVVSICTRDWFFTTPEGTTWYRGSDFKLMQYTGLKDKNGKEIYEGDIIFETFKHPIDEGEEPVTAKVIWSAKHAKFQLQDSENTWDIWKDNNLHTYQIIGNIYENKEILENATKNGV